MTNLPPEFKITVPRRLDSLEKVGEFVTRSGQALGLDKDQSYQAQLAVDEACANVIEHGAAPAPGETLAVECHREGDSCVFTLRDQGQTFDPTKAPAPNLSAELRRRKTGGLGIFLMRKLMDQVSYRTEQGTNVLVMIKRLRSHKPA
jgi:anti-sigma regulatory factor (Ser/Thr protein kinase)